MLKPKISFIDFKLQIYYGHFFFKKLKGVANEYRKNSFRSNNGIPPITRISQVCGEIQRKLQSKKLFMFGPVPLHGICSIDVSRKPSRYRSMSACCQNKTLPHGHSGKGFPQYLGRCKRGQGLANLCRLCSSTHSYSQKALYKHRVRRRIGSYSLCSGFNNNQSLPFFISMGEVPKT